MAKTIFTIGKTETSIEADGFTGKGCEDAINQMMSRMNDSSATDTNYKPEYNESDLETEKEL